MATNFGRYESSLKQSIIFDLTAQEWKFLVHFFTSRFWALASIWVIFLTSKGLTLTEIAIITTAYSLSMAIFELPTGFIADKFGRKFSIVLAYFTQFTGIFIFAFAPTILFSIIGFAIWGIGMTMNSGAEQAWLFDEIKAHPVHSSNHVDRYQRVYGLMMSVAFLSSTLAYGVGGFLAEYSLRAPIVLTGLVFLFSGIWLLRVPETVLNQDDKSNSTKRRTKEAFKVLKKPEIRLLTIVSMVVGAVITSMIYWMQPYFDQHGVSLKLIGVLGAGGVLAASMGSAYSKKIADRFGAYTMFALVLSMSISFLLMSLFPVFIVVLVFLTLRLLRGAFNPFMSTMLNKEFTSDIRATAISLVTSITTFAIMITEIGSALIIDNFSFNLFFIISAIFLVGFAIPASFYYAMRYKETTTE